MDDLVKLHIFNSREEAESALALLSAQGVEAVIKTDGVGPARPDLNFAEGVALMVEEKNLAQAKAVLKLENPME